MMGDTPTAKDVAGKIIRDFAVVYARNIDYMTEHNIDKEAVVTELCERGADMVLPHVVNKAFAFVGRRKKKYSSHP